MNIPINRNMDEYKDDVYKGLNLYQIIFSGLVLGIGVASFVVVKYLFHVPMMLTVMVTAIVTMPVAFVGFMPVCRMSVPEYLKKRKRIIQNSIFVYETISYPCDTAGTREAHKIRKHRKKQEKQVYFDDLYLESLQKTEKRESEQSV